MIRQVTLTKLAVAKDRLGLVSGARVSMSSAGSATIRNNIADDPFVSR